MFLTRSQFSRRATLASVFAAATLASAAKAASAQSAGGQSRSSRRVIIKQELPGEPQREMMLVEVTYPPGTGSPPHIHPNGVMAFVVSGAVASKVNDGPEQVFRAGEAWWEPPGALHRVSRNASSTTPATLLAIYVAPKGAVGGDLMKPACSRGLRTSARPAWSAASASATTRPSSSCE
jgi:quercetin dioxygenase-like cupin family protein